MDLNADIKLFLQALFWTLVFVIPASFIPSKWIKIGAFILIFALIWPAAVSQILKSPKTELQLASVGVRSDAQELIFDIKSNKTRKTVSTDRTIRIGIFEESKINWYEAGGEQEIEPGSTVQFSVRCPISKQMFVILAVESGSLKNGICVDYEHIGFTWETWGHYSWWPYKSAFTQDVNERIKRLREKLRVCVSSHSEDKKYGECFK